MTSDADFLYVWAWLPGAQEPTAVGTIGLDRRGQALEFAYASSYRNRTGAIAIAPDLPLSNQTITPPGALIMPGSIRDALPDGWGRRVLHARHPDLTPADAALSARDELAYMLRSSTDRFGGLDFQPSPWTWTAREPSEATLDELHEAAQLIEAGMSLSPDLDAALAHCTSIGGARPKALLWDGATQYIAKFSSSSDIIPIVQAEAVAMDLARAAGIPTPPTRLVRSRGRHVLLVERFDRDHEQGRHLTVSALTLSGLDEMTARYATYPGLLQSLRASGPSTDPGPELFDRIAFNIAISNSDDHARNHAAFWDGQHLQLTPAYDLAPGNRSGHTATQAMAYGTDAAGNPVNTSRLPTLTRHAGTYGLTRHEAQARVARIIAAIRDGWDDAAERAELTTPQRDALHGRQFLNDGIFFADDE